MRRNAHAGEGERRERGGAQAHGRLGLDGQTGDAGLDEEERVAAPGQPGADHEQLGVGAARDERLHAVEHVAVVGAPGRRGRLEHVEEHDRLGEGERRGGGFVAGERRQVRRLLLVGPPQRERGGDRAVRQGGDGDAEVTLREGLGDEGAGHRGALVGETAECLGDTEDREADLVAGLQHLGRRGAGGVRVGGRGADHLGGQLGHRVDEQLLVLGRGQVEDAPAPGGIGTGARPAPLPRAGEGAACGGRRTEAAAGDAEDHPLGLLADAQPVEDLALGELVHRGDGVPDRVPALARGDSVPGGGGHGVTVTLSYSCLRGRCACLRSHVLGGR